VTQLSGAARVLRVTSKLPPCSIASAHGQLARSEEVFVEEPDSDDVSGTMYAIDVGTLTGETPATIVIKTAPIPEDRLAFKRGAPCRISF
jgi:hypothetical protein